MPRSLILGAAVTLLLAGGAVTLAGASSPAGGGQRHHVLQVSRDTGQDIILDLDHSGMPSPPATATVGDEDVYAADFFVGKRKVGSDGGVCKLVRLPAIHHCVATNTFREGDLTVEYLADYQGTTPPRVAITGGTGRYRGAGGEVTFTDNPAPQRDDVTFHFTTPR